MDLEFLFVIGSMTLLIAMIAVAFPITVHSESQWCVNANQPCFYEVLDCKKIIFDTEGAKCVKINLPIK